MKNKFLILITLLMIPAFASAYSNTKFAIPKGQATARVDELCVINDTTDSSVFVVVGNGYKNIPNRGMTSCLGRSANFAKAKIYTYKKGENVNTKKQIGQLTIDMSTLGETKNKNPFGPMRISGSDMNGTCDGDNVCRVRVTGQ